MQNMGARFLRHDVDGMNTEMVIFSGYIASPVVVPVVVPKGIHAVFPLLRDHDSKKVQTKRHPASIVQTIKVDQQNQAIPQQANTPCSVCVAQLLFQPDTQRGCKFHRGCILGRAPQDCVDTAALYRLASDCRATVFVV
jgi:hypothetical protein